MGLARPFKASPKLSPPYSLRPIFRAAFVRYWRRTDLPRAPLGVHFGEKGRRSSPTPGMAGSGPSAKIHCRFGTSFPEQRSPSRRNVLTRLDCGTRLAVLRLRPDPLWFCLFGLDAKIGLHLNVSHGMSLHRLSDRQGTADCHTLSLHQCR